MNKMERVSKLVDGSNVIILATDKGVYVEGCKMQVMAELVIFLNSIREDIGENMMDVLFEMSKKTGEELCMDNKTKARSLINFLKNILED